MWWTLRVIGLVPLFLGSTWIYMFGFTNYRVHLAFIGLPLGLVTFLVGLALVSSPHGVRWLTRQFRRQ